MTWRSADVYRANGREIVVGTELTISGAGRFRFLRYVVTVSGVEWIDVYGGKKGHETIRSFRPERIKTVHRNRRMRSAA